MAPRAPAPPQPNITKKTSDITKKQAAKSPPPAKAKHRPARPAQPAAAVPAKPPDAKSTPVISARLETDAVEGWDAWWARAMAQGTPPDHMDQMRK
eukprot:730708-Pyramimonas_sp.AAC.1